MILTSLVYYQHIEYFNLLQCELLDLKAKVIIMLSGAVLIYGVIHGDSKYHLTLDL